MLTNAPRPAKAVKRQLDKIGLGDDSYDHIVTAGDAALEFIKKNNLGKKIYHIGPAKDKSFFDTLFSTSRTYGFSLTPLQKADFIVCTGTWKHCNGINRDCFVLSHHQNASERQRSEPLSRKIDGIGSIPEISESGAVFIFFNSNCCGSFCF